jgi:hypothetical protein
MKMREVRIMVDEDEGMYKQKDISLDDTKYLVHKGYIESIQFDLYGNKDYYMLKPSSNETPQHFFLIKAITNYLKGQGFEVWNYKTVKPDIIFEFKNRKIVIEIETGKNLRNNRRQFLAKVRSLYENYGYDWFFVVTNRNLVKKYKKYGRTFTRKNVRMAIARYVNFKPRNYMPKGRFLVGGVDAFVDERTLKKSKKWHHKK